ncbi:hypothetical protein ACLMJK_008576 [Lecanora helva]
MSDTSGAPKSPTLLPPRKSVELEDAGAHDLETSENEDDVFADASEGGATSRPQSPIPITRVEKVDDRENHGEVPGTAAYEMRTQDAVPDELEIVPKGQRSRSSSSSTHERQSAALGAKPIPKTTVEKVDPTTPSHGDVPGTAAYSLRKADAVPDAVHSSPTSEGTSSTSGPQGYITSEIPVPKTVVTKVDSNPSHGEVPGTEAFNLRKGDAKPDVVQKRGDVSVNRSKPSKSKPKERVMNGPSLIAADGGFGPMIVDDSEKEDVESCHSDVDDPVEVNANEAFGEDFDDFEAGSGDDDFGDFDEGFQQPTMPDEGTKLPTPLSHSVQPSTFPYPLLDFSEIDTLDDIIAATKPYLDDMFPSTKEAHSPAPPLPSTQNSIFTDRSLSLWSQLVAPPPLQPPNWVRSRIRRLFLVSLGVPVDLDEILPASKQKKLVLPSIHLRSRSHSPPDGRRQGSRVRLKHDNASSASVDQPSSGKTKKRRGPPLPPELDLQATKMLCATTEAALSNMTDDELHVHIKKLEEANSKASQALEYWLKRRDSALGDKEAFEGVIENLVKHARRVRK